MLAPNLPCSSPNLLSLRATAFNFASISIVLLFFCINIERILSHSHLLTAMQEHFNSQYYVWTASTISRRICHSCKIGQMIFISKLPLSNIGRHRSGQSPPQVYHLKTIYSKQASVLQITYFIFHPSMVPVFDEKLQPI